VDTGHTEHKTPEDAPRPSLLPMKTVKVIIDCNQKRKDNKLKKILPSLSPVKSNSTANKFLDHHDNLNEDYKVATHQVFDHKDCNKNVNAKNGEVAGSKNR